VSDIFGVVGSPAFLNGFGVFVGILAGVIIQQLVNGLTLRRQARTALQVMQTEISYNRSEVLELIKRIDWLKQRIASNQLSETDLFLPMQKFDYSSIGPLTNAGYFHVLLGPERVRKYLEFYHFFRIENGVELTTMLKAEHTDGRSMAFLEWVESRAKELVDGLEPIERSSLAKFQMKLLPPK
jgi:hypothetical protein